MKLRIVLEFEFDASNWQTVYDWVDWLNGSPQDTVAMLAKSHTLMDFEVNGYHTDDYITDTCSCGWM